MAEKVQPLTGPMRTGSIVDGVVSLGEIAGAPDHVRSGSRNGPGSDDGWI